jgi:protein phosphatase
MPVQQIPLLIPVSQPHVEVAMLSHRGLVRANNEDRFQVSHFIRADTHQPVLLAVLADGVGGHLGGEIAAQTGVEALTEAVSSCRSLDDPAAVIRDAILAANQAVLARAAADKKVSGMGATCACALLVGDRLYIGNLGDSRAYLADGGNFSQLTHDHTWLEENGDLDLPGLRGLGRRHPFAHVLTRYLGSSEPPDVDLRLRLMEDDGGAENRSNQGIHLQPGQQVLLCSDGLSDMLSDEDIHAILLEHAPRKAVQKLVLCALEKGGHDNVSVILLRMP